MLRRLVLDNFQSHKHTEIDFSEDLTCVVGLNNHGKSAIFRGLQKCIRNIPDGNTFVSDTPKQEEECLITVYSDAGIVTRKVRIDNASDANSYIVKGEAGDAVYAKFGRTGIPEEVLNCLPVDSPIVFGDVEIDLNFQNQIDPLFLMQGTGLPALRGKVLGRSTGVDNVQRAIQIGASEEKKLKSEIKHLEEQQAILNEKLLKYVNLDRIIADVTVCNNLIDHIDAKKKLLDIYKESLISIKDIIKRAAYLRNVVDKMQIPPFADVQRIRELRVQMLAVITLRSTIHTLQMTKKQVRVLSNIITIQSYFEYLNSKLVLFKHTQSLLTSWGILKVTDEIVVRLRTALGPIQEHYQLSLIRFSHLQVLSEQRDLLEADKLRSGNLRLYIENTDKDLLKATYELDTYKQEIKVCPTCGREWDEKKVS